MIQVKEFLNYQEGQDEAISKWLRTMGGSIKVVDIKYSVGTFQADGGNSAQEFSGVLVIYETI